jgi:uncharacterized protein
MRPDGQAPKRYNFTLKRPFAAMQYRAAAPPNCRATALKLHLERNHTLNFITACEGAHVQVNENRHAAPLIVLPQRLIADWRPRLFSDLNETDFIGLAELGMEIVLLGTGTKQSFPHPRLTRALMDKRIGFEVMDTMAACRTYNILAGEGRSVAAALLPA